MLFVATGVARTSEFVSPDGSARYRWEKFASGALHGCGFSHLFERRQNVPPAEGTNECRKLARTIPGRAEGPLFGGKANHEGTSEDGKGATSPKLKEAFQSHLEETNGQIERLETIFEMLKKKGTGKTCEGMKGVLAEGAEVIEETKKGDLRDSGLITAAQRVEHYEMAGYGGVREFARLLGQKEIVALLDATLKEEEAADKKLTLVAKEVNAAALGGSPMEKAS